MNISIELIESTAQAVAAVEIRRAVFGRDVHSRLANPLAESRPALHLLARTEPGSLPIGTLSVVDTSGDTVLHEGFHLPFDSRARVARYTQLAVLRAYRGWHVPLRLILEARARFVEPRRFEFSWLLFDGDRASGSSLCRLLGFQSGAETFQAEYGRVRALIREENVMPLENSRWRPAADHAASYPAMHAGIQLTQ